MNRPFVRASTSVPGAWDIYPQVGYDYSYLKQFEAFEGATVSTLLPAPDEFTFFTVSGMTQADVESVMMSLAGL